MKVALIDPLGQYGGMQYYTEELARGLQNAGVDVTVYTLAGTASNRQHRSFAFFTPFRNLYGRSPAILRISNFVAGLFVAVLSARWCGCTVAHIAVFHYDLRDVTQLLLCQLCGMKVVVTLHDMERFGAKSNGRLQDWILAKADGIIVHNRFCLKFLKASDAAGPPVAVIPHGNYAAYFSKPISRAEGRKYLHLADDLFVFLFFGNSRREKGLDLAIAAMKQFRGRRDVLLLTGGKMSSALEANFRRSIADAGLDGIVRLDIGLVSDNDVGKYFAAANVVLVPYRRIYESGVTIMASSLGRACIVSDLPPLLDLIDDGRCGMSFANADVMDLYRAMAEALHRPAGELDAVGALAREKMIRERDWNVIGKDTATFYAKVLTFKAGA